MIAYSTDQGAPDLYNDCSTDTYNEYCITDYHQADLDKVEYVEAVIELPGSPYTQLEGNRKIEKLPTECVWKLNTARAPPTTTYNV